MPYKDKSKQTAYQREWIAQRREQFFENKTCSACGNSSSLELHHLDPTKKISHRIWSWSMDRMKEEVSKCIIICHSCHCDYHARVKMAKHGSTARYNHYGCRCSLCREANTLARRKWRDKNRK